SAGGVISYVGSSGASPTRTSPVSLCSDSSNGSSQSGSQPFPTYFPPSPTGSLQDSRAYGGVTLAPHEDGSPSSSSSSSSSTSSSSYGSSVNFPGVQPVPADERRRSSPSKAGSTVTILHLASQGFFRRSIQQNIQYKKCLKNENCSIVRINRNRCQQCRFKKCLLVGMSRDGELGGTLVTSELGIPSGGGIPSAQAASPFPGCIQGCRSPLEPGPPACAGCCACPTGCVPPSWDPPICGAACPFQAWVPRAQSCMSPRWDGSSMARAVYPLPQTPAVPRRLPRAPGPAGVPLAPRPQGRPAGERPGAPAPSRLFLAVNHINPLVGVPPHGSAELGEPRRARGSPRCPLTPGHPQACPMNSHVPGRSGRSVQEIWEDFSLSFTPAVREVVEFAKHIPGFQALSQHDQVTLLKAGTFEVLMVRFASLFDVKEQTVTFMSRTRYGLEELWAMGMGDLLGAMFDFSEKLSALELSDEELGLFTAVVLVSAGGHG
ncbi:NR1D1 protein, partial [Illadopsis cleaveri]|nr:NR1D1 protein [Illadopsis cleaveri]